mgnify:CR=1 FL=1
MDQPEQVGTTPLLEPRTYDHTPASRAPYPLIEEAAVDLLHRLEDGRAIRLLGVRAEMAPLEPDPPA